ncbi:hypothetical protein [Bacillus phage Carmen17]|uniref:Uncharacterized protein n=1 Tax=Bacillus phage Carmen17 TaxID=2072797 RepID=A0A2I7QIL8_9CAUD|nr:hypothetical protein HWB53_gp16 [Bacillus phage Carmen17]AUR81240.1 hypothetical protein [Bacillus phage Carmen17]
MKFIFNGKGMVAAATGYIGEKAKEGSFMDHLNNFSDSIVSKEMEVIFKPIGMFLTECLSSLGHWLLINLPDLMGYTTMAAGVLIILTGMLGKANVTKTMSWYAGLFIVAISVLGGAK